MQYDKIKATKECIPKLKKELEILKNNQESIVKRLRDAAEQGDRKENSDYHEAQGELSQTRSKINEIHGNLEKIIVVEDFDESVVGFGAEITIINTSDNKEETYRIVGQLESNIKEKRISEDSPIVSLIIGKKVGESFSTRKGDFIIKKISYDWLKNI